MGKLFFILFLLFMMLLVYACVKVSADADEFEQKLFAKYVEEHSKQEIINNSVRR